MSFASPLAGLLGLALGGLLLLHVLRPQRPDHVVPATLLWREALQDHAGSVPWRRLRRSWSLLLQLVAAAAIVLALARPAIAAGARPAGHVAVVLDVSAPMQATDVAPSRFEAARAQVRSLLDGLSAQARVTLVAMGARPHVVVDETGDVAAARGALDGLRAEDGGADLEGALSLAAASLGSGAGRIEVYSDGVLAPLRAPLRLPAPVAWHGVGRSGEDVALTGVDSVPGSPAPTVAARVANQGHARRELAVECLLDGHLVDRRPLALDGGRSATVQFPLPRLGAVAEVRLDVADVLPLDDVAWVVVRPPSVYRVALVTRGDTFLLDALRLRGDLQVTVVDPAAFRPSAAWDLVVFDATAPVALPSTPVLVWGPPADPRLGVGAEQAVGGLRPAVVDPLLDGVDLGAVRVARSRSLSPSSFGGRALVDGAAGPVLLVRDGAPRGVLVGFDLHESDLPLRAAFPVLVDHLSHFLLPAAAPTRPHLPGEPVPVTAASSATPVSVARPDGSTLRLPDGGGVLGAADTGQVGVYLATLGRGATAQRVAFTVDALDPGAGSVAPRGAPPLAAPPASAGRAAPIAASPVELWPWLALLALLALLAEWPVWERGR